MSRQLLARADEPGGGYEKDIIRFILGIYIRCIGRDPDLLDLWTDIVDPLFTDRLDRESAQNTAVKHRLFHDIYPAVRRTLRDGQIDRIHVAAPPQLDLRQQLPR
jgi:hypothetical protein